VSVQLRIESASSVTTRREEDLVCDESPHRIELSMDAVSAIGATGFSAQSGAGWAVAVHGAEK